MKYEITILKNKIVIGYGKVVMEKYDEWNIELMECYPQRKGIGTILIQYIKDDFKKRFPDIHNFTVCPVTPQSQHFFSKQNLSF